jgi:predicted signal transduction protein with EAL and GGDEF domain
MEPVGPVTISIGLAALPDHGSDIESLINLADRAMYEAKEAGRNRVMLWQPGPGHEVPEESTSAPKPKRRRASRKPKAA